MISESLTTKLRTYFHATRCFCYKSFLL